MFFSICATPPALLLWHDFMFANMDYPAEDADFAAGVSREAAQLLVRLQARPSLAVVCGNSECSQQAAMSGAGREHWSPALFETTLAAHAQEYCPDVPYCPSSTHGGAFPFSANEGVTSYYGVGAYLQPLARMRAARSSNSRPNVSRSRTYPKVKRWRTLRSGCSISINRTGRSACRAIWARVGILTMCVTAISNGFSVSRPACFDTRTRSGICGCPG